jgi:IS5 family transposase
MYYKGEMLLDHALIDIIGMKQFYTLYKKIYVHECKKAGLSQNQTLIKLNNELKAQDLTPVSLSAVKYLW